MSRKHTSVSNTRMGVSNGRDLREEEAVQFLKTGENQNHLDECVQGTHECISEAH